MFILRNISTLKFNKNMFNRPKFYENAIFVTINIVKYIIHLQISQFTYLFLFIVIFGNTFLAASNLPTL